MKVKALSREKIELVKKYYPEFGFQKCVDLTGLNRSQIRNLARRLGLKLENISEYLKEHDNRRCS